MKEVVTIKSKFLRNLFDQNTYVLIDGKHAIIVDAGAELEDVLSAVKNKKVLAVLITHIHFDHVWNIEKYVKEFGCPVYICEGFEDKFLDPEKNESTIIRNPITFEIDHNKLKYYAKKLNIGPFELEVMFTPAHSSDSICLLWNDCLFTGDTLFSDGIGRTDFYDSVPQNMIKNLKAIFSLDFKMAYPGHGGEATKGKLNQTIKYYL